MQFKFFAIPIDNISLMEEDLNKFLRSHRVLSVHRDFVTCSAHAYWCYSVEYLELVKTPVLFSKSDSVKVDYKEVLSEEEFARFRLLRECRKTISTEDAVPAYAVFIDEQLADIAKLQTISVETLKTVKGVGEKKLEKYAERFIKLWESMQNETGK